MREKKGVGLLYIITASSGAGKTSLIQRMVAFLTERGYAVKQGITTTTRQPRLTERDGIDYHFISVSDFIRLDHEGYFLETTHYDGNFYGTTRALLESLVQGISIIITTDAAGARALKRLISPCVAVSLTVSDPHVLAKRMQARGMQSDEQIAQRLLLAQQELGNARHDTLFDYHIVNDDFSTTEKELIAIFIRHLELGEAGT